MRRLAGALLVTLLLAGCAAPPLTRQLLDTPGELPPRVELGQTPFFPQDRYQCGPAALATVLAAQAIRVTPESLVERVYIPALKGSLREEITAAARDYGMLAYRLQPSLSDLLAEIANGTPVLVFQNAGLPGLPQWHFAVAIGYDLPARTLLLRSGTTRRWQTTLGTFERTWSRGDHWALVVLPPGAVPATAQPAGYLRAARDLEVAGQQVAAAQAYQAATRRWPELPDAWLAWGNHRYAAGDFSGAGTAFGEAIHLKPEDPRAWNNLAYALLGQTCPLQARLAAACAVALAPGDAEYLDTRAEITLKTRSRRSPAGRCSVPACPVGALSPAP